MLIYTTFCLWSICLLYFVIAVCHAELDSASHLQNVVRSRIEFGMTGLCCDDVVCVVMTCLCWDDGVYFCLLIFDFGDFGF